MNDCLYQAPAARGMHRTAVLQGMKYIDLHCDALTNEGVMQVTGENLIRGRCLLQCFAAFIHEKSNRFERTIALAEKFNALCEREGFQPVRKGTDIKEGNLNAMLTVEEGGAIEGSLEKLETLYARGVRMMTLTWNYPNEIGFPNFPDYEGLKAGRISPYAREKEHGLTPFGRQAVERMCELKMLVDVSHGSDRLVEDAAGICKEKGTPFVASHSGAAEVCPWARNLEDEQIRLIADCGGVIGLDFCADFTSPDQTPEGQRAALLAHAEHILRIGGEDVLAIGSDFDGIPENPYLKNPAFVPAFLEELTKKFGERIAEKIARENALRVLREI